MSGVAAIGTLFGIAVKTLIGAVLLRAAVALYNKMAGGAGSLRSVPKLFFGRAMGIAFTTLLSNTVVSLVIGLLEAVLVEAEVDASTGLPKTVLVGMNRPAWFNAEWHLLAGNGLHCAAHTHNSSILARERPVTQKPKI